MELNGNHLRKCSFYFDVEPRIFLLLRQPPIKISGFSDILNFDKVYINSHEE